MMLKRMVDDLQETRLQRMEEFHEMQYRVDYA